MWEVDKAQITQIVHGNVVERLQIAQIIQSMLLLITDYTEKTEYIVVRLQKPIFVGRALSRKTVESIFLQSNYSFITDY